MTQRSGIVRVVSVVAFAILPVVAVAAMFQVAWTSDSLAIDFHNEIYPEAQELLDGKDPFPGPEADLSDGSNYIWPPFVAYLAAPLTLLTPRAADVVIVTIGLLAFLASLRVVGVRDWRVYGAAVLWAPVIGEMRTAHVTLVLCLLVSVAWRLRERYPWPGLSVGVAVGLKFFLWPLVLGLVALRKWRDAAVASLVAMATLTLLLPFISIFEYARLLRRLGETFDQDSFTVFGLLVQAGAPDGLARICSLALGLTVLALAWRRASFVLFVAAALLLSPIVWLDYFAVLAVPLAIVKPRLSIAWLLPIFTWGITSGGAGAGDVATSVRVLAIFAAVTVVVAREEQKQSDSPRGEIAASTAGAEVRAGTSLATAGTRGTEANEG